MSAAAPWSVKGIDPKAREIAKDLARRSGMTLGEWLNSMIMEDEDEGYTPMPRRPHAAETFDRRGRSRRLDDAYDVSEEGWQRIGTSVDAIAARLEAAERRSTVAIQGVDQAVSGLVRRLEEQERVGQGYARRIDDIADELREGHKRLRRFEVDTGPKTQETFGKVETSLGALAGRLYDIEERQRSGVNELRQRMDAVEKVAGPGVGADMLAQVGARLDQAQGRTTDALRNLERSFGDLDRRLRVAEARVEPEGVREAARFEKLAETLARQVDANRTEMMRRLDTAETENRLDRIERAVLSIGEQVRTSEQKSASGIEAMGREVLRMAQNLNGRMQRVETDGTRKAEAVADALSSRLDREFGRYADKIEQKLTAADDRHAMALEKLGGEITRISDRLSERIAQSERRSQQALEDIGRRLSESSDKIDQRYDRASGELAERMRMSEERTARLLAEARDSIEQRSPTASRDKPLESPAVADATPQAIAERISSDRVQADWRAAAFPDETFDAEQDWSADPITPEAAAAAPFPGTTATEISGEPEAAHAVTPQAAPIQPFAGFGGADVEDALEATAPSAALGFASTSASRPAPGGEFDGGDDDFGGETDFVDPRQLRASMGAAAARGRASSTQSTIDAARAAMTAPEAAEEPRQGFGLKPRGGKSKLQERLDKQAARDGSTVKKAFLASVTAVALTGVFYGYTTLADSGDLGDLRLPGLGLGGDGTEAEPIALAAMAVVPADAAPVRDATGEGATAYEQALEQLEADPAAAVETLKKAANLGYPPAQAHLAVLYQTGENGVAVNLVESRRWARRAAEGGDAKGMHFYAMELYDGVGGERNRPEALAWLKRAADLGLVDSQYNVARLFENGDDGIARNPAEALKWYTIAARAGDQQAQGALARLTPTSGAAARRAARLAADAFQAQGAVQDSAQS